MSCDECYLSVLPDDYNERSTCYSGGPVTVQLSLHVRELLLNENDMVGIGLQTSSHLGPRAGSGA